MTTLELSSSRTRPAWRMVCVAAAACGAMALAGCDRAGEGGTTAAPAVSAPPAAAAPPMVTASDVPAPNAPARP